MPKGALCKKAPRPMRPFLLPITGLLCLMLGSACSFTKDLEQHRSELLAATAPGVSLSEKRDALGYSAVRMMDQAVTKLNPKKGVKYVEAYARTNGALIDTLAAQIQRGQADMSQRERVGFLLSAASRPYAKQAIDLLPKFVRKFKQIQAVPRITGSLKDAVLGKAVEGLGGLLGRVERGAPAADVMEDGWDRCAVGGPQRSAR